MYYLLIIACLSQFVMVGVVSEAKQIVNVDDIQVALEVGKFVEVYTDTSRKLSIQEIISHPAGDFFTPHSKKIINRTASLSDLWLRLTYSNNTSDDMWLEVGDPFSVWELACYIMPPGEKTLQPQYAMGALLPSDNKLFPSNYYCIPLPKTQGNLPTTVYIKISGDFPMTLRPQLIRESFLHIKSHEELAIFYLFLGIVLAMLSYNFFLFISTRDKTYLAYVFYVFCTLIIVCFTQGHNIFYFPFFYKKLIVFTAPQYLAMTLFLNCYFDLRKNAKPLFNFIWTLSLVFIIILPLINLLDLMNYAKLLNLFQLISPFYYLVNISIGIYFLLKKYFGAIYYVVGWSILFLSMALHFLLINGLLEYTFFTSNIAYMGFSIEVLIFGFALGSKISKLKDENLKVQQVNNSILSEQNIKLDKMVRQKTKELDDALYESKELNEELQVMNEELQTSNEELFAKNTLIFNKQSKLEQVIKNLKETQTKLIQSEKMASLGILTAGVAHEINNPLNFIKGAYIGLKTYFENHFTHEPNNKIDKLLNYLNIGIERTVTIVQSLNEFSSSNEKREENIDIEHILNNCLTILGYRAKGEIRIEKHFNHNPKTQINGNKGELHQVFVNIITNSIQAIDKQGVIRISTYDSDSFIVIEISDTGCGISKENLLKVTDPFYTTKAPGVGTGLGMSISYNIIKEHGGNLTFSSELGKGTTVKVTLPFD
ncbi:7TM diverse intracellular signaling domain-containing protein [Flammeovirgaceae bacterium SG7u.111]|nr:7TM diverse intracellular signaling domain-containing protein [Flammeovirgaceae bacterium SG7u.132]WPO38163.1 7TM diverse intracellular signaling domain-containing protein [Flammeovirgaceae bacterium SG7u.111]